MKICRGMILAAGKGMRMRPLTKHLPKPLCEYAGKPLIIQALENFSRAGLKQVVINLHYLGAQISHRLGNRYKAMEIFYQNESNILGTGGGIREASRFLSEDEGPYLIANADMPLKLDAQQFLGRHLDSGADATLLVAAGSDRQDFAWDDEGRIHTLRPTGAEVEAALGKAGMFCGYQLISRKLLEEWPQKKTFCFVQEFYAPNLKNLNIYAFPGAVSPPDLSSMQDLMDANMKYLNTQPRRELQMSGSQVEPGSRLGPNVIVGVGSTVKSGAEVSNSIIFESTTVSSSDRYDKHIVGNGFSYKI